MFLSKYVKYCIVFAFSILLIRIIYTQKLSYIFLAWNLFLAFIPFTIDQCFLNNSRKNYSKTVQKIIFIIWILFLPNAPYLITDFVHLRERNPIPFYFDLILVFTFVFLGLYFFFSTVNNIEKWWKQTFKSSSIIWYYSLSFGLCSFGIYLGRYERFNSWEIITTPIEIFKEVALRLLNPFDYTDTWIVTIMYSILLFLVYKIIQNFKLE